MLEHVSSRPAVCLCSGIVVATSLSLQIPVWISSMVGFFVLIMTVLIIVTKRASVLLLPCFGFVSGVLLAVPQAISTDRQMAACNPGYGHVEGMVVSELNRSDTAVRFTLSSTVNNSRLPKNTLVRVTSYQQRLLEIHPGQIIQCDLVWHRVTTTGYDRWLWLRGIYLKGTLETPIVYVVAQQPLRVKISMIRQSSLSGLTQSLPDWCHGLVKAIALGDTSNLSNTEKKRLADTGIIHILSPSGLHVSIVFGFMWIVLGLMSVPRWVRIVMSLLSVWMYALICGAEAPALRSATMCSVAGLAQWAHRDRDALSACALAAIVILAWQPISLLDPSFQMSFVMVSFVLVITASMARRRYVAEFWPRIFRTLADALVVGILVALAAAPLSAFYFERVSIVSPITNLLVSFAVAVITCMAPGVGWVSSMGFGSLAEILGWPLQLSSAWIDGCVKVCISLPYSSADVTAPSVTMMIVYYSCYLSLLIWIKSRKGRGQPVVT